jgi:hypothetical protein
MVEVVDLIKTAESEEPQVKFVEERKYAAVYLMENGWVRCSCEIEQFDGRESMNDHVDYFPPERINGVYGHDELEEKE